MCEIAYNTFLTKALNKFVIIKNYRKYGVIFAMKFLMDSPSGKKRIAVTAILFILVTLSVIKVGLDTGSAGLRFILSSYSLAAASAFFILVPIKFSSKLINLISMAIFVSAPFINSLMVDVIADNPPFATNIYFTNLVFYIVPQVIAFAITQSVRVSVIFSSSVIFILHLINEVVLILRGTPLVPSDFFAIKTALSVSKHEPFILSSRMVYGALIFLLIITVTVKFTVKYSHKWQRAVTGGASLAAAAACVAFISSLNVYSYPTSTFDQYQTNQVNGIALSFYINVIKMQVEEPMGYSPSKAQEILDRYETPESAGSEELPNVIVIMNETFSDLKVNGDFETNQDYMPYINSMSENTIKGQILTSVFGGGTCNTEFEFITGLSMFFQPEGSYPYMQRISKTTESFASHLNSLGYTSIAVHPFWEVCWKRDVNYPLLGFSDFISGEDFSDDHDKYTSQFKWEKSFGDNVEYVRKLISDREDYRKLIELYENKGEDEKLFLFNVTIQNHSGYTYKGDDFETTTWVNDGKWIYPKTNQYLSLIKESDTAFGELIEYFKTVDEPTVILMFGDHQPKIEDSFYEKIIGSPLESLTTRQSLTRYITPYIIWANYDIEEGDMGLTSPNYLSTILCETAGIPLSQQQQFLSDVKNEYPAIDAFGYYDSLGIWHSRTNKEAVGLLEDYNYVQYYLLEDEN